MFGQGIFVLGWYHNNLKCADVHFDMDRVRDIGYHQGVRMVQLLP